MRGFPKNLNTKEDYLYIKEHFSAEEWKPHFQALLDTLKDYFFVKTLGEEEAAPEGEQYKVVDVDAQGDTPAHKDLYELRENPSCKLRQLGFTKTEVQTILTD